MQNARLSKQQLHMKVAMIRQEKSHLSGMVYKVVVGFVVLEKDTWIYQ
jgi:hypothetical protein